MSFVLGVTQCWPQIIKRLQEVVIIAKRQLWGAMERLAFWCDGPMVSDFSSGLGMLYLLQPSECTCIQFFDRYMNISFIKKMKKRLLDKHIFIGCVTLSTCLSIKKGIHILELPCLRQMSKLFSKSFFFLGGGKKIPFFFFPKRNVML